MWRIWLVLAGRGFGKTRVGAEWVREQVKGFEFVNLIGKDPADARDVMIEGESGIMAVCPPWERPTFLPSLKKLRWPSGAVSLIFSGEEPEGLRGPQHQRLWGDEPCAWQYPMETFDMAMFGLRLPPDPRVLLTSTPKPIPMLRDVLERPALVITKGSTYENRDNLDPGFFSDLITRYEGTRLGRQELEAEVLLDEGLAYRVTDGVHVVPPMALDTNWLRFESMDYGTNNPCWLAFAVDYDGNVVAFGLENEPGLVSEQAARIHARRTTWWPAGTHASCYAPPDIKTRWGKRDVTGKEVSAETEFAEHGITFAPAQNDRRAGFLRVSEMLRCYDGHEYPEGHPLAGEKSPVRYFPAWHSRAGEPGAPQFYILDTDEMAPLVKNLRDAPMEDPESPASRFPGEAVDFAWEHSAGHAHAACRYGLMSRPSASTEPDPVPDDPRAALLQKVERDRETKTKTDRYQW